MFKFPYKELSFLPKAITSPGADSLESNRSDGDTRYTAP